MRDRQAWYGVWYIKPVHQTNVVRTYSGCIVGLVEIASYEADGGRTPIMLTLEIIGSLHGVERRHRSRAAFLG